MRNIIVIGIVHHNTLGMVRCLGQAGYKVILLIVGKRYGFVSKSRYVKCCFLVNEVERIPDVLVDDFKDENNRPIIISNTSVIFYRKIKS